MVRLSDCSYATCFVKLSHVVAGKYVVTKLKALICKHTVNARVHIVSCIVNCLLQNPQQTEAVMRLRIKLNIVGGLAALNRFMSSNIQIALALSGIFIKELSE